MNAIKQYSENNLNFISIENNQEKFRVVLCDLGASLYEVIFDNKPMTIQVLDSNDFKLEGIRFGKTMGRVSGRIAGSAITIDGTRYQLETNDYANTLHGGHNSLAQKQFKLFDLKNDGDKTTVAYQYVSPHLEAGFPGNLTVTITYVIQGSEIKMIYNAISDAKTPVSLTNHAYYCLGDQDIRNINLCLKADKYLDISTLDKLPIKPVAINNCFNFNNFKNIMKDINDSIINTGVLHGYDNYFYFKETNPEVVKVQLDNGKYHLDMYSDYEGTMVYTNNTPKLDVKCNTPCKVRKGMAIEPQEDQLKDHMLEPNKPVEHWIRIKFSKK